MHYSLLVVIYIFSQNWGSEDFRKKSSFFKIPPVKKAVLRFSPTNVDK